jgi:porphobilinogen synthase
MKSELYETARKIALTSRPRRLRRVQGLRNLVRETRLAISDLMYPIFVDSRLERRMEISSLPGIYRQPLADVSKEVAEVASLKIPSVLIFGLPKHKDSMGSEAYANNGIVQQAVRTIKKSNPDMIVATDVCLCQYTDHGHCGVIRDGKVVNDESIELLSRIAVSHAEAGADIVGPSAMMDGQVKAIRSALDDRGLVDTSIMAYSAKYASSFYGPFREAAESAPVWGDRRNYQMDPPNRKEAMREMSLDIEEGADIIMVKPALSYLDVVRDAATRFNTPLAAYNVSGECAMIKAAAQRGMLDERSIVLETLTSMKRAGARIIITYFAKDVARWMQEDER